MESVYKFCIRFSLSCSLASDVVVGDVRRGLQFIATCVYIVPIISEDLAEKVLW